LPPAINVQHATIKFLDRLKQISQLALRQLFSHLSALTQPAALLIKPRFFSAQMNFLCASPNNKMEKRIA
jgi:hypothetical protein